MLFRSIAGGAEWFSDYGLQLSRGFRALKVWLSFKEHGLDRYGRLIDQNIAQARRLSALVRAEPELELMHIHKTGALIRASVNLGALCGRPLEATERERLDHYAKCAGLLFQVVDDILDATADTTTLGKTAGKDEKDDKPTYVSILGLAAARRKADDLLTESLDSLAPFGGRGGRLADLARFIARRTF